jgi:translation initiation factor IF-1
MIFQPKGLCPRDDGAFVAKLGYVCQLSRAPKRTKGRIESSMSKGDLLEMEGCIQDALGGGQYTIKVDQGGALVRAQLSGRMRRHHIRVLPGDRVRVAVSPYDLTHGLIVSRGRS